MIRISLVKFRIVATMLPLPMNNGKSMNGNGFHKEWSPEMEAIRDECFFEIRGSEKMRDIFWQIATVRKNSNVILMGDSGSGKTLIARTIHGCVYGKDREKATFLETNLGGHSPLLVESELFGHEQGAFTGANRQRIGRFEEADNGTVFLDEIVGMSMETQLKLLAALDDPRHFERVGSNKSISPNLVAICATTENLIRLIQ